MDNEDANYVFYLVSQNLKRLRIAAGLTQEKLAKKANFSSGFITNLESKKYFQTVSLPTVYHLANVLNVDIREFFRPLDK